jgi:mono/diheme cytochrome c family protein
MGRNLLHLITLTLILAACGTVATPVAQESIQETRIAEAATAAQETADAPTIAPTDTPEPTATPVPPTATPVPPTATTEPTEAPTEAVPTEVETSNAEAGGNEVTGDPAAGEEMFNMFVAEVSFACSTCHLPNSEAQLIGPGLLNISIRAADRVEGETAEEYIHNSILHPSEHVVEGFPDMLMPQTYADILSDEQVDNLVAYLFTLTD